MARVKYTAGGRGQAPRIRIGADLYVAGREYTVTKEDAADLVRRGGFVLVKEKNKGADDGNS